MASCCYQPRRHELNNISSPFPRALERKLHPAVRSYTLWPLAAGSHHTIDKGRVLLTSLGYYSHHYTMNVRCMEYVKNNMNVALIHRAITRRLSHKGSSLICHMILLKQQCWPPRWYGHTPLCSVTSFAHNTHKQENYYITQIACTLCKQCFII